MNGLVSPKRFTTVSVLLESKLDHGRRRTLIVFLAFLIIYSFYCLGWVTVPSLFLQQSIAPGFLPIDDAHALCLAHGLKPYAHRTRPRKIYDLVLISNELDWLEIRVNELQHHVDYFIILEATSTFTGIPKPLHFSSNLRRLEQFHPKIIYHALSLEHMNDFSPWGREAYTRNSLFDAVIPSLLDSAAPKLDDVILVSDIDEIPRPSTLTVLRNCKFPKRTTLRSRFFYYSFQWQHIGDEWPHPQATYYQGPHKTIKPQDLRRSINGRAWDFWNASWHCSSCFATIAEMSHKMESFSHFELDKPEFKVPSEIVRRVRNGLDLFNRSAEKYEKVDSWSDVPEYLKVNPERFDYMLDRDPADANFRDYVFYDETEDS